MLTLISLLFVVTLTDTARGENVYKPTSDPNVFVAQTDVVATAGKTVESTIGLPPITTKSVDDFVIIWKDTGSGADRDVSYWRPSVLAHDYFALGDMVEASHNKPRTVALAVKEIHSDALRPPASFTEIWNDRGSGADSDVRVMRMNPPAGYKCLGNVVVEGYSTTPDASKYRCVKSDFVTTGGFLSVWNDAGSGADRDVSSWAIVRGSDVYSQEAGCFLSSNSHSEPSDTPYMLSSHHAKNHLIYEDRLKNKEAAIKLYRVSDVDSVWKDSGSGADHDMSCWRAHGPGGTFRMADIPRNNYNKPGYALIAKDLTGSALKPPTDYRRRWKDSGSGADKDVAFWNPVCPGGYVAMGHLCTKTYAKPSLNDMRCVNYDLVSTGSWEWVWNDAGSGADADVSVYRAVSSNVHQQALDAMGTIGRYANMDLNAYVLQGAKTLMVEGKPAKSYRITNVNYKLDDRNNVGSDISNLGRLIVENRGTDPASATMTLEVSSTDTRSWANSFGLEIGVSVEVEAGVPLIGKSTVTVSATTSYSHEAGGEVSETKTVSMTSTVSVKGRHQKTAILVGTRYRTDIPYTADITTVYEDGSTNKRYGVSGIYTGVDVSERRVIYEKEIPL